MLDVMRECPCLVRACIWKCRKGEGNEVGDGSGWWCRSEGLKLGLLLASWFVFWLGFGGG